MKTPKPKTITIHVTARDLREGKADGCTKRPVELAMSRALGRAVVINNDEWRFDEPFRGTMFRYQVLPIMAHYQIGMLDSGRPVKPFTFTVRGGK